MYKTESPVCHSTGLSLCKIPGNALLSHGVAQAVPSALEGLTALFGMGRGVSPPLWSPENRNRKWRNGYRIDRKSSVKRKKFGQAARLISIARLNTLLCVHLRPIYLVISQEPSGGLCHGIPHLGGGFPLRCFQRLSLPNIATQRCPWRDNWYTSGSSIPVLSY